MSSPFASRIAGILKVSLTPLLKSHGFRKEGSVYVVSRDKVSWIVDVQRSRWNDVSECQFTINGGVYMPGIVSVYSGRPDPVKPRVADCCVSVRIGMLDESRLDKWWKLTARDNPEDAVDKRIAREVSEWVENLLLPFFDEFPSPAEVAEFLEGTKHTGRRFFSPPAAAQRFAYASLLYLQMGNNAKARSAMEQALRDAKGSPVEDVIKRLSKHAL